jgi:hypothetical protein
MLFKDDDSISTTIRWFQQTFSTFVDSSRLYCAIYASGERAIQVFSNNVGQKYFQRQIYRQEKSDPPITSPYLLTIQGHKFVSNRSYGLAIHHFLRAWKLCPNDPLVNLSLGCAYLHRAMQRKVDNRHYDLLCGFSFFMKYFEARYENENSEVCQQFVKITLTCFKFIYGEVKQRQFILFYSMHWSCNSENKRLVTIWLVHFTQLASTIKLSRIISKRSNFRLVTPCTICRKRFRITWP